MTAAATPPRLGAATVAMVAYARKLPIYANAVVARGTPWQTRDAI